MIERSPIKKPMALTEGQIDETESRAVAENMPRKPAASSRGTFWSRHSAIINFWLDVFLLVLFVLQAWMFAVLHVVFPRGAGSDWKIWGATPLDWSESLFTVFCIFAVAIVLHVMLHWEWICGIVATRILRQKNRKDDGSHTLIGVSFLIFLVHAVIVGILISKSSLINSNRTTWKESTTHLIRSSS